MQNRDFADFDCSDRKCVERDDCIRVRVRIEKADCTDVQREIEVL